MAIHEDLLKDFEVITEFYTKQRTAITALAFVVQQGEKTLNKQQWDNWLDLYQEIMQNTLDHIDYLKVTNEVVKSFMLSVKEKPFH